MTCNSCSKCQIYCRPLVA